MSSIKAVFFDFFGVLYPDTFWGLADQLLPDRDDATQNRLHELIRQVDLGLIDRRDFWQAAADEFGVTLDELKVEREKLGDIDQRLLDFIKNLKDEGYKTGIISNIGNGFLEQAIGPDVVKSHFDVIVLSGEVHVRKPDRLIYEVAINKAGVDASECLFYDDIQSNVDGAISAGMLSKLYTSFTKFKQEFPNVDLVN